MSIHDIYETRIRAATERVTNYLGATSDETIASFDLDVMAVKLPNGLLSTLASDAVNFLEAQEQVTLSESERLDVATIIGIVFGAALQCNGGLDEHLTHLAETTGNIIQ